MTAVERTDGQFIVSAQLLAKAFDLSEGEIRQRLREGAITSLCETGVDEDAGHWRMTFFHRDRACRFIVDAAGTVLKSARFPIGTRAQTERR